MSEGQETAERRDAGASRRHGLLHWLLTLLLCAASSAGSVWVYDRWFARDIVAVDLAGFVAAQREALATGAATEAQVREALDGLERRLGEIPPRYAVITADVALRNLEVIGRVPAAAKEGR